MFDLTIIYILLITRVTGLTTQDRMYYGLNNKDHPFGKCETNVMTMDTDYDGMILVGGGTKSM